MRDSQACGQSLGTSSRATGTEGGGGILGSGPAGLAPSLGRLIRHRLSPADQALRAGRPGRPPRRLLPHVPSALYLQALRCTWVDTAGPASAPAGRLLSANTRLTAGQLIAGALVCSAAGQKGGRGGAWSHACRWPLDRRHRTGLLIPALPLVPAELGEVLPITGPQFPTCKMGRSRHSSAVGLR